MDQTNIVLCMNLDTFLIDMNLKHAQTAGIAPWDDQVDDLGKTVVYIDRYPCTPGHRLYVPKDSDNANCTVQAMEDALAYGNQMIGEGHWDGFNIGYNSGEAAGQTVMYPHVHLIPRRQGDVDDPVGGVRNTIPGKGNYKK